MNYSAYIFTRIHQQLKLVLALILFIWINPAFSQSVTNGDFETGDFTGWMDFGNVFVISSAVISGNWSVDYNGGDGAANGELMQTISVNSGDQLELSFNYGYLGLNRSQQLNIQVDGAGGIGSLVDDSIIVENVYSAPQTYRIVFFADAATLTLRLSDLITNNSIGSDMIIDNVRLQIPELVFQNGFEE